MMNMPLTSILGPLGGDQLIITLSAVHTEGRAMFGYHRCHGNLPIVASPDEATVS
jgi:hypothetical protein